MMTTNNSCYGLCYTCKHIKYDGLYSNGYCTIDRQCKVTDAGCKVFDCNQYDKKSQQINYDKT